MKYNVILLDADGTLFDFHQAEEVAFKAMLDHINKSDSFTKLFEIYLHENKLIWQELERGEISQETLKTERFQRFLNKADIQADANTLAEIFMITLSNTSILYDDALDVVKQLAKEATLAIVTNGLKEVQHKRVRESLLKPYISITVISDELDIQKPDPKIIDYTLKQLNHPNKDDVVIVGDSLTSDIQGGMNAGIDTVWFNPYHKKNTLKKEPTYTVESLKALFNTLK